jgi:hypothetical protein
MRFKIIEIKIYFIIYIIYNILIIININKLKKRSPSFWV